MTGDADKSSVARETDDLVTSLLAEAQDAVKPDPQLMARVIADAEAHQPRKAVVTGSSAARAPGFFSELMAMIGGWPALSGMATAAVAGLWIGFSGLSGYPGLSALGMTSTDPAVEMLPGADVLMITDLGEG